MRPRPYLSWSCLDLFERSKERWIELYIHNQELKFNPHGQAGIDLGRIMADSLEHDELTGDALLDLTTAQIPKLATMERALSVEMSRGKGKEPVPLMGKLDSASEDLSSFREYKQGTTPWTQPKVDKWGQITFYATMIYILRGQKPPQEIWLDWIPTERQSDGSTRPTGEVKSFRTNRSTTDILKMMARMSKAWDEIEKVMDQELL